MIVSETLSISPAAVSFIFTEYSPPPWWHVMYCRIITIHRLNRCWWFPFCGVNEHLSSFMQWILNSQSYKINTRYVLFRSSSVNTTHSHIYTYHVHTNYVLFKMGFDFMIYALDVCVIILFKRRLDAIYWYT